MSPARMVTLFSDERLAARDPLSFFFSAIVHGLAAAGVVTMVMKTPQIIQPQNDTLYAVRLVQINTPEKERQPEVSDALYHALHAGTNESSLAIKHLESSQAALHVGPRPSQLLLQTAAPSIEIPKDVVPNLIILSPRDLATKHIAVAEIQKQVAANIHPAFEMPNDEPVLADVQIASSPSSAESLKLRTSAISPLANHQPDEGQKLPQTQSTQGTDQPAARIIAISDVHLVEGQAAIPHVNSRGEGSQKGSDPSAGKTPNPGGNGNGAIAEGMSAGSESGSSFETTKVSMPKNGHFSMVLVGDSTGDQYPEANSVWKGRLAYTVYLKVGLSKSWIMQYTQPESAAQGGSPSSGHIDPPWPIDMVIPHLDPDSMQSEALIVRGLVNTAGHFESISMVFPSDFPQTAFVLNSLKKWTFRPAMLNGAAAPAEILIIIPEQD